MTSADDILEFTPAYDTPVPYMQRLRDYYLALGYGNPYRWAQYAGTPFAPLTKPLTESRLALITTAAPFKEGAGDQGPGAVYNAAAKFYEVYSAPSNSDDFLGISHLGYDRKYTTAEDVNSFFPMPALEQAVATGRLGAIAPRFYGTPTNRSQVTTIQQDCADIFALCQADEVDVALLVPN